jgi:hypothetical protein
MDHGLKLKQGALCCSVQVENDQMILPNYNQPIRSDIPIIRKVGQQGWYRGVIGRSGTFPKKVKR